MEIDLNKSPVKVSQIDQAHWASRSSESGLIKSQIVSQSSLGDSLTAIPNTSQYTCKYTAVDTKHIAIYLCICFPRLVFLCQMD